MMYLMRKETRITVILNLKHNGIGGCSREGRHENLLFCFFFQLKDNFINLSLEDIVNELKNLLKTINDMNGFENIATDVKNSISHIQAYKENILIPMNETAKKVIVSTFFYLLSIVAYCSLMYYIL